MKFIFACWLVSLFILFSKYQIIYNKTTTDNISCIILCWKLLKLFIFISVLLPANRKIKRQVFHSKEVEFCDECFIQLLCFIGDCVMQCFLTMFIVGVLELLRTISQSRSLWTKLTNLQLLNFIWAEEMNRYPSTFWIKVFVNNTKKNEMLILFDVLPQKKI